MMYFRIFNVVEKCNHQDQGIEGHSSIGPTGGTPRQLSDCSWCGNSTTPSHVHAPLSSRRRTGTPRGSGTELGSQRHWLFLLSPVGHRHHRDSQEQNSRHTQWSHYHIRLVQKQVEAYVQIFFQILPRSGELPPLWQWHFGPPGPGLGSLPCTRGWKRLL